MNPNLRESHIANLSFYTSCNIPEPIREKIKRLSPPGNRVSRFLDVYVHNRVTHRCILTVEFKKSEVGQSLVNFEYQIRPAKKLSKTIPKIRDIIGDLCVVEGQHNFNCYSSVEYPKREKRRFIVHLPMDVSESPKAPISSIRGLSVEGTVGSQDYASLLLVAKNGDRSLTLFFKKKYSFSKSLPDLIVSDVNMIANALVI